jgi:hypothetical protein
MSLEQSALLGFIGTMAQKATWSLIVLAWQFVLTMEDAK